jgi:hypothetical protein
MNFVMELSRMLSDWILSNSIAGGIHGTNSMLLRVFASEYALSQSGPICSSLAAVISEIIVISA